MFFPASEKWPSRERKPSERPEGKVVPVHGLGQGGLEMTQLHVDGRLHDLFGTFAQVQVDEAFGDLDDRDVAGEFLKLAHDQLVVKPNSAHSPLLRIMPKFFSLPVRSKMSSESSFSDKLSF